MLSQLICNFVSQNWTMLGFVQAARGVWRFRMRVKWAWPEVVFGRYSWVVPPTSTLLAAKLPPLSPSCVSHTSLCCFVYRIDSIFICWVCLHRNAEEIAVKRKKEEEKQQILETENSRTKNWVNKQRKSWTNKLLHFTNGNAEFDLQISTSFQVECGFEIYTPVNTEKFVTMT